MTSKAHAAEYEAAGFRKAVPPEPKQFAQCRNCVHFVYDSEDRMNRRGEVTFGRSNLRCRQFSFPVNLGTVCNSHAFKHALRRDA